MSQLTDAGRSTADGGGPAARAAAPGRTGELGWPDVPRQQELAAVVDALRRGRSVVVVGPVGVGKTHLVGRALAQHVARRRSGDAGPDGARLAGSTTGATAAPPSPGAGAPSWPDGAALSATPPTDLPAAPPTILPTARTHPGSDASGGSAGQPAASLDARTTDVLVEALGRDGLARLERDLARALEASPEAPVVPDAGWLDDVVVVSGGSGDADAPLALLDPRLAGVPATWSGDGRSQAVVVPDDADTDPVLVRVEDAHLLEPVSARTLALLARQGRVQVVATVRPAGASQSPWMELWKDGVAERVDLAPFTPEQTEALLRSALGGPMTSDTGQRVWDQTRGIPFYLRELVRSEVESGGLVERGGIWVGMSRVAPGPRLLDLVRRDLAELDPTTREALDLIALAEPVPANRLADLVPAAVLERLVRDGIVSVARDVGDEESLVPEARVLPPMHGEAVRALVPLERRRRLLAVMRGSRPPLATAGETREGLLRSVVWALECGVRDAPERLVAGMRAGLALHRPDLVVQIGHAALEAATVSDALRADVLLLRAQAWRLMNQPARASRDLAEVPPYLTDPLQEAGRTLRAVRLAEQEADLRQFADDDADGAVAILDAARDRLAAAPDGQVLELLATARLRRLGWAGRFTEALGPSVRLLAGAVSRSDVLRLTAPTVLGLGQAGRFQDALQVAERHLRSAAAHQDDLPWLAGEIEVSAFLVHLWSGDVGRAEALLRAGSRPRRSFSGHDAFSTMGAGLVLTAHGQWSDALRELRLASARLSVIDPRGLAAFALAAQAVAAAAAGDGSLARRLLAEVSSTPLRASAAVESDVRLHLLDAGAWLRRDGLRADALALARWCAERGLHRTEAEALHRAVLAGHLAGTSGAAEAAVVDRLAEVALGLDGDRPRGLLAHARAVLARDGQMVAVAARELGRCGLWLPTAGRSEVLTRREREIASLAAGGLSSREIAQRLTLSVRTVDSHLSRVFAKLGIRSRQELGPALRA